jgi:hypothetical protein
MANEPTFTVTFHNIDGYGLEHIAHLFNKHHADLQVKRIDNMVNKTMTEDARDQHEEWLNDNIKWSDDIIANMIVTKEE